MRSHLSPLDATLLEIEEGDAAAHMHFGWALVFDPPPGGERPSLERLRRQTGDRLGEATMLRRRLSMPQVGGIALPVWLPDPDLDIGRLIRRARLPHPGAEAELTEWLGGYFSVRLDRSHPLWETVLLEGLPGGSWALACKVHHCLIDGVSGVKLMAALLDAEPEPDEGATPLAGMVAALGEESRRGVLARLRGNVGEAVSGGIDAQVDPHGVAPILSRSRRMAEALVRDDFAPPPATSLNRGVGANRRLAALDVPLADLKKVRQELGGTVNDVVLAAVAGGLRRLFEHRREEVDRLRAMVPVSLRRASDSLTKGDRLSSLFVDLAIAEADPVRRYRRISAAAAKPKGHHPATEAETTVDLAGLAPPLVQSVIARLAFAPDLFNVTVVNVPAAPTTLYALGAPMRRVVPLIPISSGHAVGVAAVSYDGNLYFGLNADRDSVPDLEVMRAGIEETLGELALVAA